LGLVTSALAVLAFASPASATVVDPASDYLSTYTGPQNGDVDILSGDVAFDGTSYFLTATLNGSIGSTTGSIFVWGVNRGSGTARLTFGTPSVGAGILFDSVIVMFPDGTLRVVTFPLAGAPTINVIGGGTGVAGDMLSATVPLALLGSMGFALDGTNAEIADFLPGSIEARAVPEPATWLSMLLGFGVVGSVIRRRRKTNPLTVSA
jgi:hypothetical protein